VLSNILRGLAMRGINSASGGNVDSDSGKGMRAGLLAWAHNVLEHSELGLDIKDFWESWKDGVAFCAIVENVSPGSIDVASLTSANAEANLNLAFSTAEKNLGIPPLLQASDFAKGKKPDEKSVMNYVCMLVSVGQSNTKREDELESLKKKQLAEKEKRADEVLKMKATMEQQMVKEKEEMEAKKLHMEEEIRDTMEKLMHLKKESATNQAAATDAVAQREQEAEDLRTAFKAMKDQLTVEQDDLLAGFDKERAEFRKRIQDLQDEVEQLNETLAQEKMERERSREALQEQVDEAHKELENVVDNFRSQLTTSAFKQRVEQDEIDQQSSFSQLLKDSINQQKSFKDFINSLPNLCGYALTQHAHNTNELPSHFTPCHTAPHSTTQHHTASHSTR
jgi:DNA repair exonuclease SbcCD ATPase subunit